MGKSAAYMRKYRTRIGGMGSSASGSLRNLGGASDKREDIQKSFVDELGFEEVLGTNGIPTATLNSYAIALKQLEREYGAIAASEHPRFMTGNSEDGVIAAVYSRLDNPREQFMAINSNVLGSTPRNLETQRRAEQSGHHTATDGKITSRNAYSVTHEYGHMVHNVLAAQSGQASRDYTSRAQSEITAIAVSRYGAKGSVSHYGTKNSNEFFAEAFASLHSGSPNAFGLAMGDWLKSHRIR